MGVPTHKLGAIHVAGVAVIGRASRRRGDYCGCIFGIVNPRILGVRLISI